MVKGNDKKKVILRLINNVLTYIILNIYERRKEILKLKKNIYKASTEILY